MKTIFSVTIALRHPLPFVYGVIADVVRWPAFWPSCRKVVWESENGPEKWIRLYLGRGLLRRLSVQGRIIMSPGRIRFESPSQNLWFEFVLEDDQGGTFVSLTSDSCFSHFEKIKFQPIWKRSLEELLPALRRRLDDLAWSPNLAQERPESALLRLARG